MCKLINNLFKAIMAKVKNTPIQGDISIGRNNTTGGNTTIQGNLFVKGRLKVDGIADLRHINEACKGLFGNSNTLVETYPAPINGWFAYVGSTSPYTLWRANNKTWESTNTTAAIQIAEVHLNDLWGGISENQNEIAGLQSTKADRDELTAATSTLNTAIATKADAVYVDDRLDEKADAETLEDTRQELSAAIATKADAVYVDAQLAAKADGESVHEWLENKADIEDMLSRLSSKADLSTTNNAINEARGIAVEAQQSAAGLSEQFGFELEQNATEHGTMNDSIADLFNEKASMSYVNAQLAAKADAAVEADMEDIKERLTEAETTLEGAARHSFVLYELQRRPIREELEQLRTQVLSLQERIAILESLHDK